MRLAKKDIVKKQVWDSDHLGDMPASLVKFFGDTIQPQMENRLISAISQITRINKQGLESLWNDIDALTMQS